MRSAALQGVIIVRTAPRTALITAKASYSTLLLIAFVSRFTKLNLLLISFEFITTFPYINRNT